MIRKQNISTILFFLFIVFLPHTRFSVPAVLKYELTVSDISVISLFFVSLLHIKKISSIYKVYLLTFIAFLFSLILSFPSVRSFKMYFSDLIPVLFAFIVVVSSCVYFSMNHRSKLRLFKSIFLVLFSTILISALPAYYQLITGIKPSFFYDRWGWRYTFMCQNPNQFGVFVILYSMVLTLMAMKYFKQFLPRLLFLYCFFVPAALFSGSKTVALVFGINILLVMLINFTQLSFGKKIIIAPIFIVLFGATLPLALDFIQSKGGQVGRAIRIYDAIGDKGLAGVKVGGVSGKSMDEALVLFQKNPLTGIGLANKPLHSRDHHEIHNSYLKILAEAGLVGFIGFMSILLLPLLAHFGSKSGLFYTLIVIIFYVLFLAMNWPHTLFRQRWVWVFMILIYTMARIDKNGNVENSRFQFLNI